MNIIISKGTIINEGRHFVGSLIVKGDRIIDIIEGNDTPQAPDNEAYDVIDAEGCYILPGIIDTHVHFREPGLTHKADIESEFYALCPEESLKGYQPNRVAVWTDTFAGRKKAEDDIFTTDLVDNQRRIDSENDLPVRVINDIRQRAKNSVAKHIQYAADQCEIALYPDTYFKDKETARKCLQWERRLELAMENGRYFDLRRWGIASKTLNAYFETEKNDVYDGRSLRYRQERRNF